MKKNALNLIMLIAIGYAMVSCKKDEVKDTSNTVVYDGKTYKLKHGYFYNNGPSYKTGTSTLSGAAGIEVYLTTDNIENSGTDWTGTGNLFYFYINSSTLTELSPGTYTISTNEDEVPMTYDDAAAAIDYNIDTDDFSTKAVGMTSGSLVVKKSGTEYTIDFDMIDKNGKKMKGNFKGSLLEIE